MRDLSTALAAVGAFFGWRFVVMFWWRTGGDWMHNAGGRHLMLLTADLAALLTLIVVARVWPEFPGRAVISLVLFAGLVVQMGWRNVLMDRAQRAGQKETADRR